MRRPLIIANWKMNTTLSDAMVLATSIRNQAQNFEAEVVICPPFTWLAPINEHFEYAPENVHLGAQNMWFTDAGPVTGEISPVMLKSLVKFVILGHSERRSIFHETDELINDKVHAALKHGISPVICVGEFKKTTSSRSRGRPSNIEVKHDVISQLKGAIEAVSAKDISKIIIAYEPVWAIGTGNAADGIYANEVVKKLRELIAKKYSLSVAEEIRILYGGSVDPENVLEFLYQREIDGVLAGTASLKLRDFLKICQLASSEDYHRYHTED